MTAQISFDSLTLPRLRVDKPVRLIELFGVKGELEKEVG